jgi:hypothetical protein
MSFWKQTRFWNFPSFEALVLAAVTTGCHFGFELGASDIAFVKAYKIVDAKYSFFTTFDGLYRRKVSYKKAE